MDRLQKIEDAAVTLEIGGIAVRAASDDSKVNFGIDDTHVPFMSDRSPDAAFKVHGGEMPKVSLGEKVFESGGLWRLFQWENGYAMPLHGPQAGADPYALILVEPDFKSGEMFLKRQDGELLQPFQYPFDEVLMVNLLARKRGIEIHGCGVIDGGEGVIFVGVSGAGKSTLANLWKKQSGVQILSDDRLIVRPQEDGFMLYGTPWHGDAGVSSPAKAPLKKIFFLKQDGDNSVSPLRKIEATTRLFVCCFPTFYYDEGMAYTVDLCAKISANVPCFELGFVPEESAIEFVRQQ